MIHLNNVIATMKIYYNFRHVSADVASNERSWHERLTCQTNFEHITIYLWFLMHTQLWNHNVATYAYMGSVKRSVFLVTRPLAICAGTCLADLTTVGANKGVAPQHATHWHAWYTRHTHGHSKHCAPLSFLDTKLTENILLRDLLAAEFSTRLRDLTTWLPYEAARNEDVADAFFAWVVLTRTWFWSFFKC